MRIGDEEILEIDGIVHEDDDVVPARSAQSAQSAHDLVRRPRPVVAQIAVVAATGFAAGAVTVAMIHVVRARHPVRPRRHGVALGPQIVATRSFLIDVHVLAPRD